MVRLCFYNGKTIHTFTQPGTFASVNSGPNPLLGITTVEYLVVGGGGGGAGQWWGGGGGAGACRSWINTISGPFSHGGNDWCWW